MARKSRKQTAAPMPAPSLYVHVALYIRLSVEDNKKRGCSVENQKLVLNDFLSDKPDFVVYDTYIDNGATGTNFHRPGFQQMLSDIEAGHINCVIVKDLSRLGRNSIDTGYYIEQYFHAHNVRFIAVTDQFDTADSGNLHGGIMLPLKNMINEAYALDIGRKIKAQARQAMKDGDYIGARAPYGYRKDPDNCHKLLIDENTAPVVKQIFEWAHEHVALNRIVRNLNEMGIPAPSHYKKATGEITSPGLIGSGKWQTRTVMKILESEVYTGDLVQGKTKIVDHQQVKAGEDNLIIAKCTHEPIISHELFNAVQEYRKQICEESKATPKRPYTPNIFKGKVFCADCGRSLHRQRAERRKGPDTYWFHCLTNSRVEKDSCKGAMIQEKELISTVTAILEKELTVALGMSLPLFQLEARQKQEKDKLKIQMSAKRQEIEKTRRLIRGLYENFVQGILTNDEYFELKADYEHAINALSGEIEVFEKSMDSLDNQLARYRAMEKDAKTLAQDHVLTAELIERLIERIPCHGVRIKMADLEQVVFETIRAQMCPALGIDSNKDKLDLQTVQQAEHEEKLRSIQDSKRHLYEQYALGEIDLETYRTRKAVYDTELVQAKNVHAVITAQTKQIKSDYEIKLKQQEIMQEVGNANMLTKALIDRLINKVYVFPGERIEIEYATQDFLETKESEKEV